MLAVAVAGGMGIPLTPGDPGITAASTVHDAMATYVIFFMTTRSPKWAVAERHILMSQWRITLSLSLDGSLTCSVS